MNKKIIISCLAILLGFAGLASGFEIIAPISMLPHDLPVDESFSPGPGSPVGRILSAIGEVVIVHKDTSWGHWAKSDLPIFEGDTIATRQDGRIQFRLNDTSVITMASNTTLMIEKSEHDPDYKVRNSLIRLALGKARFYVRKLLEFSFSEFQVTTPTATIGVRGSKWIVEVTQTETLVTTEEDTVIEVWSRGSPENKIQLGSFRQTSVFFAEPPSEPTRVTPESVEQLKMDLAVPDEISESGEKTTPFENNPALINANVLPPGLAKKNHTVISIFGCVGVF